MLIGISGKIGSGKSTLTKLIIEKYSNLYFKEKSFAKKLKEVSAIILNLPEYMMGTHEGKNTYLDKWGMTIGQFQQKLGTEGMRKGIHPDGWIISLLSEYSEKENWIISDVRFKNEAKAIRDNKGILIRINGDPKNINKNSSRDTTHLSEIDLDDWKDWDLIITNIPPIDNLNLTVDSLKDYFLHLENKKVKLGFHI